MRGKSVLRGDLGLYFIIYFQKSSSPNRAATPGPHQPSDEYSEVTCASAVTSSAAANGRPQFEPNFLPKLKILLTISKFRQMIPESGSVPHEEVAVAKSPLDKPLQQLTEDDIAQVTREDCRRYLKEKGMRRPSWNKSQAIQQVIMLKALLETPADCDADFRKKLRISRPNKLHNNTIASESVPQGACRDADSALALDAAPYRRKDVDKEDASGGFAAADDSSAFTRATVSTKMTVGQMTIFYSGEVNVYEDVPLDKAQEIMHIAASPILFPQERPVEGTVLMQSSPWFSKAVKAKACPDYNVIHLPSMQTVKTSGGSRFLAEESNTPREENPVEESFTRKASVQRYLEKKKDRFKIKRKAGIVSCSSLDIYFNHQMGNQITNEPLSGSDICSPPQIMPPSTPKRSSSVDNDFIQNIYTYSEGGNQRNQIDQ
ncbi:protein TIFY 4B-like isoform X4 [Primulina eburnea]|uniref:protein TIFY 4B-like isoform X4 n=1 Tax=Primulina eburnea TaxID=1245227 RepID=UPI003C6C9B31